MDTLNKALSTLGKLRTIESSVFPHSCDSPLCPLPLGHRQGKFLFEGQPAKGTNPIWGESNPPPQLWRTYEKFAAGNASDEEKDEILAFAKHHAYKGWKGQRHPESEAETNRQRTRMPTARDL